MKLCLSCSRGGIPYATLLIVWHLSNTEAVLIKFYISKMISRMELTFDALQK